MRFNTHSIAIGVLVTISLIFSGCENQLKREVVETFADGSPKIESFYTLKADNKEVVKEIQYYENGQKKYVGFFKKGKKMACGFFGLRMVKKKVKDISLKD